MKQGTIVNIMDKFGKNHAINMKTAQAFATHRELANTIVILSLINEVEVEDHITFANSDQMMATIDEMRRMKHSIVNEIISLKEKENLDIAGLAAHIAHDLIFMELTRQRLSEKFTPEHDDQHTAGQLADFAASLLITDDDVAKEAFALTGFYSKWFKRNAVRLRNLIMGTAVAHAEIERVIRGLLKKYGGDMHEALNKVGMCRVCPNDCTSRIDPYDEMLAVNLHLTSLKCTNKQSPGGIPGEGEV
jgi:hypothetical protein